MILPKLILLTISTLLVPTLAQSFTPAQPIAFTNTNYQDLQPGALFNLTWTPGDGTPVNITLLTGTDQADLFPYFPIAVNASGTSLDIPIPATIPAGSYALSITQSGYTAFSPIFSIDSAGAVSSIGSMAASSSSSTGTLTAISSSTFDLIAAAPSSTSSIMSGFTAAMPTAMMISSLLVNASPIPSPSGVLRPPPIIAPPPSAPSLGFSSPLSIGTGVGTVRTFGTGTGAPYPTGVMNGSWMGNVTATVAVVTGTVTIECASSSITGAPLVPLAPSTIQEFTGGVGTAREGLVGYFVAWMMVMAVVAGHIWAVR